MAKALMMFLGGLSVALALVVPAWAEDAGTAPIPKTYAVLVGISKYSDEQIKPRPHAEADAEALRDVLVNKKYVGATPDDVKLLLAAPRGRKRPPAPTSSPRSSG